MKFRALDEDSKIVCTLIAIAAVSIAAVCLLGHAQLIDLYGACGCH